MKALCKDFGQARRDPDGKILWCEPGNEYDVLPDKDGKLPAHFDEIKEVKPKAKPAAKTQKGKETDL